MRRACCMTMELQFLRFPAPDDQVRLVLHAGQDGARLCDQLLEHRHLQRGLVGGLILPYLPDHTLSGSLGSEPTM